MDAIASPVLVACFYIGFSVWLAKTAEERLLGPWPQTNIIRQILDVIVRVGCILFFCLFGWAMWFVIVNTFHAIVRSA